MEYLIENWYIGVIGIVLLSALIAGVYGVIKTPSSEQMKKVKKWLLFAVLKTEQELGSGTGKLKLSYAFDLFVERFPLIAKLISFEVFSMMVDEALETMKDMLKENKDVRRLIEASKIDKK